MGEEVDTEPEQEVETVVHEGGLNEIIDAKPDNIVEELEIELEDVVEPEKEGSKRLRIFCPVCGMLSDAKRYLVDHPFPNVMEYHYKGRGKITCDYVLDNTEETLELVESVKQQLISVIKNAFTIDQMRDLNRALVVTINNHDEEETTEDN